MFLIKLFKNLVVNLKNMSYPSTPSIHLKVKQLRRLCKVYGLKNEIRKIDLRRKVDEYRAARKIQWFFMNKISRHDIHCSICLLSVHTPWITLEGHRYHSKCLLEFFNSKGKTQDPVLKRKVSKKCIVKLNETAQLFQFPIFSLAKNIERIVKERLQEENESQIIRALEFTVMDMQSERTFGPHAEYFEFLLNYLFSLNTQAAKFFTTSLYEISKKDCQFRFQIHLQQFLKDKIKLYNELIQKDAAELTSIQNVFETNFNNYMEISTGNWAHRNNNNNNNNIAYEAFLWRLGGDNLQFLPPAPTSSPTSSPTLPVESNSLFPSARTIADINPAFLAWTLESLGESR
jgi:hypothetical protein